MQERNATQAGGPNNGRCGGVAPFIIGVVAALVVGWWLFPKALYSEKTQPLRFSHTTHVEMAGMYCEDCHYLREDGTFNGLPTTEQCASCHMDVMGSDPAEARFVEDYVRTGKEVDWEVYQYQPDNVFFSHAAHNFEQCTMCHADLYEETGDLCNECHPDVASTDTPPAVEKNVITGYSKGTMKMWACERCHALEPHRDMTYANNACFTCHK